MSFDLRRCSKEDLDELNERGREWRAMNSPDTAVNPDPETAPKLEEANINSNPVTIKRPERGNSKDCLEGSGQLAFGFLADSL